MNHPPAAPVPASVARGARLLALLLLYLGAHPPTLQAAGNEADAAALRTSQAAIGRQTSDLEFVDGQGRPLRLADLRGRPLVVSLVFTRCQSVCSGLTLHLRQTVRIGREALGARSFGVLTVGFDSANDTPERMREYARVRGIVDPEWQVASGDAATLRRFTDELGFTWSPSARGFDHITQVTVLDARGVVVQQVYGEGFAPPELLDPLRQLLLEGDVTRASVRGVFERIRLYCSVYDPGTRRYRFDWSMFAGALPALLVLAVVAAGIVAAGRRKL